MMGCWHGIKQWYRDTRDWLDDSVENSYVGKYFALTERRSKFSTEIRAGTVTFLTMAYIMSVNANIIADTGGPCSTADCTGVDKSEACKFFDPGYEACVENVRGDLVTATAASSLVACFIMGAFANMPLALAPGMGLNAYFAYNVVGYRGTGTLPYATALAAVFIEGWIFVLLSVTGVRAAIIRLVPRAIMLATSAGIGLFLAFTGLQATQGLGLSVYSPTTVVSIGGCPLSHQVVTYSVPNVSDVCVLEANGSYAAQLGNPSNNYTCVGGKMHSAALWLGLSGLVIIAVLMQRKIKGSIMIGIVWVTAIAWIPNHGASYFHANAAIAGGEARWQSFKVVVKAPNLRFTGAKLSFTHLSNGSFWLALLTFLYVDFLDTTGTLFSMANFLNNFVPGFVNENKQFPRQQFAFVVDGLSTVAGSLMGTSPISTYIESASGIREGGRTGLTALTVCFYFFVSLFFSPLLANIPPYAVGPALLIVGSLMVANVAKIPWDRIGQAIPAFITLALMPLTYSIAYGVIGGLLSFVVINGINAMLDQLLEAIGYVPKLIHRASSVKGGSHQGSVDGSRHGGLQPELDYTFNMHGGKGDGANGDGAPYPARNNSAGSFLDDYPGDSPYGSVGGSLHGANNMGGPKDSATSQLGLAPVLGLAAVEVGDTVRRESDRSGRVTPSNGGSMRGSPGRHLRSPSQGQGGSGRPPRGSKDLAEQVRRGSSYHGDGSRASTPTAGARSSKFRRQKSFAELYGDDSLDDSPTTPGTDIVLDMEAELTMRGLSDGKQAELAASLAEPFRQPAAEGQDPPEQQQEQQQQQQPRPEGAIVGGGAPEPGSAEDPSAHSSDRSFELNPQRFDPDSGSSPDPSLHAGPHHGGPVKRDGPSEVSRDELALHVDSGLQGSLRATL